MPNIVVKHKLFYSYKLIYPEATATARALKRQQHLDHQLICLFVRVNAEIIQDIILGRPLASFILAVFWWSVRPSSPRFRPQWSNPLSPSPSAVYGLRLQ